MNKLQNLSAIDTNTLEGRYLIAALSQLSAYDPHSRVEPDYILEHIHEVAEKIYENAPDVPTGIKESRTFEQELTHLINSYSVENESDTPDWLLSKFLTHVIHFYGITVKERDRWFDFHPWKEAVYDEKVR